MAKLSELFLAFEHAVSADNVSAAMMLFSPQLSRKERYRQRVGLLATLPLLRYTNYKLDCEGVFEKLSVSSLTKEQLELKIPFEGELGRGTDRFVVQHGKDKRYLLAASLTSPERGDQVDISEMERIRIYAVVKNFLDALVYKDFGALLLQFRREPTRRAPTSAEELEARTDAERALVNRLRMLTSLTYHDVPFNENDVQPLWVSADRIEVPVDLFYTDPQVRGLTDKDLNLRFIFRKQEGVWRLCHLDVQGHLPPRHKRWYQGCMKVLGPLVSSCSRCLL